LSVHVTVQSAQDAVHIRIRLDADGGSTASQPNLYQRVIRRHVALLRCLASTGDTAFDVSSPLRVIIRREQHRRGREALNNTWKCGLPQTRFPSVQCPTSLVAALTVRRSFSADLALCSVRLITTVKGCHLKDVLDVQVV
jgi:hypothetical protein